MLKNFPHRHKTFNSVKHLTLEWSSYTVRKVGNALGFRPLGDAFQIKSLGEIPAPNSIFQVAVCIADLELSVY